MKVVFIGQGEADETKCCTVFGRDFFRGIETDVSDLDEHARKKLATNGHFKVTEPDAVAADAEVKRKPGRPRTVRPDDDVSEDRFDG